MIDLLHGDNTGSCKKWYKTVSRNFICEKNKYTHTLTHYYFLHLHTLKRGSTETDNQENRSWLITDCINTIRSGTNVSHSSTLTTDINAQSSTITTDIDAFSFVIIADTINDEISSSARQILAEIFGGIGG
jgi:hypothetical protein